MTDFFASLAARYRGEADVLRPRVPSRFEPVSASLAAASLTADAPWSQAPWSQAPWSQAPWSQAPWSQAPWSQAPWSQARPGWPLRSTSRPDQADEPGRISEAGEASRPTVWPEPSTASGPRSAGPRQASQDRRPPDQVANAEPLADGATRAGRDPGRAVTSGSTERHQVTTPPAARPAVGRHPAAAPVEQAVLAREVTTPRTARTLRAAAAVLAPEVTTPHARRASPVVLDVHRPLIPQSVRRPEPRAEPTGEPHLAAAIQPDRWPSDQRRAHDHAGVESSGAGQEHTTVVVTIGRVDVQAVQAATPAAARPATRPAAGPSLADYLKDRSRAARARP